MQIYKSEQTQQNTLTVAFVYIILCLLDVNKRNTKDTQNNRRLLVSY
nr:MAG TPA: hypothetical protein [Caudoviricetes sp.]